MNRDEKKTIVGKILEVRTTADGDYDWSPNCWEAKGVLIITDKGRYAFTGAYDKDNNDFYMEPLDIVDNYKQEYPFTLHRYSLSEITLYSEEYDMEGQLTDIMLCYEDVWLWISGNSVEYILLSVHKRSGVNDEGAESNDLPWDSPESESADSKYLPWDEFERNIRIEFDLAEG